MLRPGSEAEMAEVVAGAREALSIRGGGTRQMAAPGVALSAAGLTGITLYEPGALTMVAQAGTPLAEVEAALAAENQRLAFDPADYRPVLGSTGESTIGGVFAGNVSGPRRVSAGAARDFLLGVRFVDGRGRVIANGGRVMKNVTGYDLVKLLAGSCGALGVLTEVAFKVLPRPETEASLILRGLTDAEAIAALAAAMRSPYEVSCAAHLPGRDGAPGETLLRLEGFADSVSYRMGRLRALLRATPAGAAEHEELQGQNSAALWEGIRDVAPLQDREGDLWRVSCKPSEGPAIAARSGAADWFFDLAGGLVWLLTPAGHDLRAAIGPIEGHATYVRGAEADRARLGRLSPEPPGVARLTAGLRGRFDPEGRFAGSEWRT